ncbi:VanW family protein [Sporosarcina sp. CAU 1771]
MKLKYFFPIITWSILALVLIAQVLNPSSAVLAQSESTKGQIAGIEIESTKKSEILAQVVTEVEKWKQNDIIIHGTTAKISMPSSYIDFDITKTVDHYMAITTKPWYKFWGGEANAQILLELTLSNEVEEALKEAPLFYVEETLSAIQTHSSFLKYGAIEPVEVPLTKDVMDRISFEVQEVKVNASGLPQIVEALNDTTVLNGETFSLLAILENSNTTYNDETANFVASTLYSTVLQSELSIKERHSQNKVPNYLQLGVEAKVDSKRNQDFAFVNNTNRPVSIYSTLDGGRLSIELYSLQSDTIVTIKVMNQELISPRTIQRLTPNLAVGQEKVEEDGANGYRVQVYRSITNGSYEKDELISRDFYPPKNKVVLVSSLEPLVSQSGPDGSTNDATTNTPGTTTGGNTDTNANGDSTNNTGETNNDNNTEKDDNESVVKEYDKGGNLITSDSY